MPERNLAFPSSKSNPKALPTGKGPGGSYFCVVIVQVQTID